LKVSEKNVRLRAQIDQRSSMLRWNLAGDRKTAEYEKIEMGVSVKKNPVTYREKTATLGGPLDRFSRKSKDVRRLKGWWLKKG